MGKTGSLLGEYQKNACYFKFLHLEIFAWEGIQEKKDEEAAKRQGFQDDVDARDYVMKCGTEHWLKLKNWNLVNKKLTGKENRVLDFTINYPHKPPLR